MQRHAGSAMLKLMEVQTLAAARRVPAPRSFWRESIARRVAPTTVHEYLIDEANLRGFWGAFRSNTPERPIDSKLSLEDLVVGLLAPQAPSEARVLKLVLRLLQSASLNVETLLLRARREGAMPTLFWLLEQVPAEECTPPVRALRARIPGPPRGYTPLDFRYDSRRLIRHVAGKQDLWRRQRRSS
jgi:hypothetical protein